MDEPKPPAKEFHEGEEAVRRFEGIVKKAVNMSPEELKKRDKAWREKRSRKARSGKRA